MPDRHLEAFLRAAERHSFSKAAQELYISTPSLIQQINLLERSTGLTLFERTRHGVTLTPAGASYYQDVKQIKSLAETALQKALRIQSGGTCEIRIGLSPYEGKNILSAALPQFLSTHLEYSIKFFQPKSPLEEWKAPLSGLGKEYDFISSVYLSGLHKEQKRFILMQRARLALFVPQSHPLAARDSISAEDCAGEKIVMFRRGISKEFDLLRDLLEQQSNVQLLDVDYLPNHDLFLLEQKRMLAVCVDSWGNPCPSNRVVEFSHKITIPCGIFFAENLENKQLAFLDWASSLQSSD